MVEEALDYTRAGLAEEDRQEEGDNWERLQGEARQKIAKKEKLVRYC